MVTLRRRQEPSARERGVILGVAIAIALLASIAAYTVLQIGMYQARHAEFYRDHTASRYAAEAGLVWAQQNLYANPTWGGGTLPVAVGGANVNVVVTVNPPCAVAPCPGRTVQAKVTY